MSHRAKDLLHAQVHEMLEVHDGHGVVALATGSGKTKCVLDFLHQEQPKSVLWVVPTEELRDVTVPAEFEKWNFKALWEKTRTICYHSLPKLYDEEYEYIILDEMHKITDLRYEFFFQNMYERIIGLTATPPEEKEKKAILEELGLEIVFHLDVESAVKRGIIAPFDIILHPVMMNKTRKQKITYMRQTFEVTELEFYDMLTARVELAKTARNRADLMKQAVMRKQGMHKLGTKYKAVKHFLRENPSHENMRTLIFAGNIKRADDVSSYRFHSKSKKHIGPFNDKQIHELAVVKAADEGLNFVDLHRAVLAQIDSKTRAFIQRIGRVVRMRPGHRAEVHIFYYKETVDEKWVMDNVKPLKDTDIYERPVYTDEE